MNLRKTFILLITGLICWYPAQVAGQKNGEQKLYTVAKGAYQDGLYDIAIGQLQRFLSRYPKSSFGNPARLMLAESFYQKKDYSSAISNYQKLVKDAKSDQLNYRLGTCYYRTGEYLNAATIFSRISRNPKTEKIYPEILFLQAECLLRVKKYKKAEEIYQKFIDKFSKHPYYKNAFWGLGWSQFQGGNFEKATVTFEHFIKEYPPIPQRARAQFLIAFSFEKQKKLSQAISAYEKFLNEYPKDQRAEEARLRLGLAYFDSRFYDRAVPLLEKYIHANSKDAEPYLFRLGLCYLRLEDYKRGQKYFARLIKDFPRGSSEKEARYYLAYCYLKQKQKESALKEFQKVVKKFPQSEIAKSSSLQIGILRAEKKEYKEAKSAFQKALSSKNPAEAAEAQYRLADTIQKGEKPSHALIYLRDLIKNYPDQKNWVELAQLKVAENLAAQGDFKGARNSLRGLSKYRQAADRLLKEIEQKK